MAHPKLLDALSPWGECDKRTLLGEKVSSGHRWVNEPTVPYKWHKGSRRVTWKLSLNGCPKGFRTPSTPCHPHGGPPLGARPGPVEGSAVGEPLDRLDG